MTASAETGQGYLLDNAAQQTGCRFSGLETGLDENTKARLSAVGITAGWRCLEIGAGSGSIARWMAERVGAHGHVLATDIDTRWIQGNGLSQRHDVAADPLAQDEFDLIHARLVLGWLPTRDAVLSHLVAALRPEGGLSSRTLTRCCITAWIPSTRMSESSTRSETLSTGRFSAGTSTPPGRALCLTGSPWPGSNRSARPGT
jgi:2-polyprenyl-3-methyl-5-hydroxy-6-metoxy-1,4-benzoquinol methylase